MDFIIVIITHGEETQKFGFKKSQDLRMIERLIKNEFEIPKNYEISLLMNDPKYESDEPVLVPFHFDSFVEYEHYRLKVYPNVFSFFLFFLFFSFLFLI